MKTKSNPPALRESREANTQTMPAGGRVPRLAGVVGNAAAILAAWCLASCAPGPEAYQLPVEARRPLTRDTLAVGDVVRLTYVGAPEFNQVQKIQPNGRINLPRLGEVQASGRSLASLQHSLTDRYREHLTDSTVVVSMEVPSATVYVSGAVNQPGKVPLDRQMTALEAVMESGGFSSLANPKNSAVIRTEGGRERRYPLNLGSSLGGGGGEAFYLRPYDIVHVNRSVW